MSTARFTEDSPETRASETSNVASECTISKERAGEQVIFRLAGVFDRVSAWTLRGLIERESGADLLLDFGPVRDCSDLGVAVLAHGLAQHGGHVLFRGLRQHELRILRYCGIPVDETSAREAEATPASRWGVAPT